jgi:hypothetical protein
MREPGRVDVVPLFRPLHEELVGLLKGLSAADWERPTVAGTWRVRDVAAHLLDTDLRRISSQRDGWALPVDAPVEGWGDLVKLLNGLNARWVETARRRASSSRARPEARGRPSAAPPAGGCSKAGPRLRPPASN